MAYTINKFNGEPLITLQDASIDTSTALNLVGRSYVGYGEIQNENFVHLMENFANDNPPARPIDGQTWFDTQRNLLNVYDGEKWVVVGAAILSETPPEGVSNGSLWFKTNNQTLHIWSGSDWTFIGPETADGFGVTRARSSTLLDSDGNLNPVIFLTVNDTIIAIVASKDFTIEPSAGIIGFNNIAAGITTSSLTRVRGSLEGVASQATRLENTRTINGVGFNGTSNITITALTTNPHIPGDYIVGGNFNGSSSTTWNVDATSANVIGKVVARNSQGGFAAGTITADLVGNVTAPQGTSKFDTIEANRFIGAVLTGNAESATRLRNPRKINGVDFNGTADITVAASAQTLTGTFINSGVKNSALESLGTLNSLKVADSGITVGSADQFNLSVEDNFSKITSIVAIDLVVENGGPDLSFVSGQRSLQLQGPNEPALISNNLSNIGIPGYCFNKVYANSFIGNATSSTLATRAQNLTNGSAGSIPFQTAKDTTAMLPIGAPGNVLQVGNAGQLFWSSFLFEELTPGNFIVGASYDTQAQTTWSVDATSSNTANKVVARDASGNFSAGTITASLNGNATTTTQLQTARLINGVPFDGTANIFANYTITFGNTIFSTSGFTNQVGSFNNNANFFDVFPPGGKTMSNFVAFIPSIAVIHYAGNVNADDSMRCTWANLGDRIRVWVQNTEQRSTPAANFLAIWS
jgi:hypothetical protein